MARRVLAGPPGALELYARAAAAMVPGAGRLPFVAGGGESLPDLELALDGQAPDPRRLADYASVCGLPAGPALPATFPHVLAFPLHMALMTDGRFPFPAVGLVHVANRITQHEPIPSDATLSLRVRTGTLEPHPRGRTFSLLTECRRDGRVVWESESTMLRRGGGDSAAAGKAREADGELPTTETWRLASDLGRRYGAVSGDRNPIHMHDLSARLFGFPRAIAHGMWTKARCVAALELPDAFSISVGFRKPILLPADVVFATDDTRFRVAGTDGTPHLEGTLS